ncbi:MAG: hypothetical protein ACK4Q5_06085 [Saprospiraceae bacterium]
MSLKNRLPIVWETSDDGEIVGRIVVPDTFAFFEQGADFNAIRRTLIELVQDYIDHEGKSDPTWHHLDASRDIEYEDVYDLTTVFEAHPVNMTALAREAGINAGLLRQYASGIKFPTAATAHRIETALRNLGRKLSNVNIRVDASRGQVATQV